VEKADLSKGYQNPKRKLGVTRHFSEIIQLKLGKKLPSLNNAWLPTIFFLDSNYPC